MNGVKNMDRQAFMKIVGVCEEELLRIELSARRVLLDQPLTEEHIVGALIAAFNYGKERATESQKNGVDD